MAEARRRPRSDDDDGEEERPRRRASSASRYTDDDDDEKPRGRDRDSDSRRGGDDDEDEPRSRRRRNREAFDEGADEARGGGRSRDADDDDEKDERPRRGATRVDDDDEKDERPRRSRGDDDDERPAKRSSRRSQDDDDGDERPAAKTKSSRRGRDDDDAAPELGGWEAAHEAARAAGRGSDRFKPGEEPTVVKIMDDKPFASYNVHWVNKRPYTCISRKTDCPLCEQGHETTPVSCFNVVVMDGKKPKVIVWEANRSQTSTLEKKGLSRSGPLTREYWSVTNYRQGGTGPWKCDVDKVRDNEVEDDWGMAILTDKELDALDEKCKSAEDYVKYPPKSDLREVARKLDDDD